MGDTAKRFSSLLTVICRTAKRSANKVAKIRKKKNGGDNVSNTDAVVASPCKTRVSRSSSSSEDHKGMTLKMSCRKHFFIQAKSYILISVLYLSPTVEQNFNETYELHHILGQGGFAMVYAATRVRDRLPVRIFSPFFSSFLIALPLIHV